MEHEKGIFPEKTMPRTKNQFERLLTIHNKLATGQRYTLTELRQACTTPDGGPSERTLYNDLTQLRDSYGAPIPVKDRSGRPYFYRPGTHFSLHGALSPEDAALANEVSALLKQLAHLPQFSGLDDVFVKFGQRAGVVGKAETAVVQWEQNRRYTGQTWLTPLYEAIRQGQVLRVIYTEFDREPTVHQFTPYLLKEYNNRWHIYGWGQEAGRVLNLALDRITDLTHLPALCPRPNTIDWEAHLANVIGFTRTDGEMVQPFVVRVWFPRAHYLLTKPLHGSQTILDRTARYVDLQVNLLWNREFEAALFELGPDAELLKPADRRVVFAEKVRNLAGRYEK